MESNGRHRNLLLTEDGLAQFVLEVLDKMDEGPERIAAAAEEFGSTRNQFVAVLLARYIVEKFGNSER